MRLLLCSLLLVLSGCGLFSSTPVVHRLADNAFEVPVVPSKMDVSGFMASSADNAPDMIITVPASDKPTVVEVRKTKRTIIDKALTNKPAFEVKSDNPEIKAAQPKKTLWRKWLAVGVGALFFVAIIFMVFVNKLSNFSPMNWFRRK